MGSYTFKITHDVIKIALLYLPILGIAFVQRRLCKGAPKRAAGPPAACGWRAVHCASFW